MEATILSVNLDKDTVKIEKENGKTWEGPISIFSGPDRMYIRAWPKRKPNAIGSKIRDNIEWPSSLDKRVRPGKTFSLEFAGLPLTSNEDMTELLIRIPEKYNPSVASPLLVWIDEDVDTGKFDRGLEIVNEDEFIVVGLPVPESKVLDVVGGEPSVVWENVWDYQKEMLDTLEQIIPNIDRKMKIVAGFGDGARCIDGLLSMQGDKYSKAFNVFVLVDSSGSVKGRYPSRVFGNHFYYRAWGSKSMNKFLSGKMGLKAMGTGMKVEEWEMSDVAHDFPKREAQRVKSWIYDTVFPAVSPKIPNRISDDAITRFE